MGSEALLGRDDDVAAVTSALLRTGRCALVGPGGVGKSSVARAVARSFGRADQVVWVDAEPVVDAEALLDGALRRAGIERLPGEPPTDAMRTGLDRSPTLVVLDGVEHLIGAVEQLAAGWPGAAGGPWLLTTSRIVGSGLHPVVRLRPLPIDGPDSAGGAMLLQEIGERGGDTRTATARGPLFQQVLSATGGLPVAIALTADHIARFGLVMAVDQPVPVDQIVLRCIDRTLALLADEDRRLFARLGLTAGPFTLDLLCAAAGVGSAEVARTMAGRLIDHGLLFTVDGRFDLLPPIRDGALLLLHRNGDVDAALAGMASWVEHTAQVQGDAPLATNLDSCVSVAWMLLRSATLRPLAYPAVTALFPLLYERLRQRELLALLEAVLTDGALDLRSRAEASRRAALCAAECDTIAHARSLLDRSLEAARELDDSTTIAKTWSVQAWISLDIGEHATAVTAAERSIGAAGTDRSVVLGAMRCLAETALATGDLDRAEQLAGTVLERADGADTFDSVVARTTLGWCLVERGRRSEAVAHARRLADDVRRQLGTTADGAGGPADVSETSVEAELIAIAADPAIEPQGPSLDDQRFAWWMRLQQRIRLAARLPVAEHWPEVMHTAADVVVLADLVPLAHPRICAFVLLGDAALAGGDLRQAARAYEQALRDAARGSYRLRGADAFDGVAALAMVTGRDQLAAWAGAAAARIRERCGAAPWPRPSLPYAVPSTGRPPDGWLGDTVPTTAAVDALARALREPASRNRSANLTSAERHVARLVRQGMTNNEIAAHLVISRRTVESHLGRIFRKLDLRTRTQLAMLAELDRLER